MGGFRTFYADTLDVTAGSAAAEATWSSSRSRLGLAGSLATFENDGWAAQGAGSWAQALTVSRGRGLFTTADASGYSFDDGTWAGLGTLGLIGAIPIGSVLGTATVTAGGVRRLDGTDDPLVQGLARLRRERGVLALDAWGSATRAGAQTYGDLAGGIHAEWTSVALDLTGGGRFGDLGNVGWAQGRAALHLVGPGWIEVSAGRYPPDVTGFASGTFVQAGLRASLGRTPGRAATQPIPSLAVEHESDGTVVLTFRVDGREPVEIAGDWNGWTPQPVTPVGPGLWRARLVLEPGLHRFTLIDGRGAPFVPDGIPSEPDDFGTSTGLLTVPQR